MEAPSREDALRRLVEIALAEDLGTGDLTGEATVPVGVTAEAVIVQKEPGVIHGLDVAEEVFSRLDPEVEVRPVGSEGVWREDGLPFEVASVTGPARSVLAGERVALNFLGHLSGVATLTARYVEAVRGTGARILDTRKTTPGMRLLEKRAVAAGGGANHRLGLYDAVLIKENHIALAGGIGPAVAAARRLVSDRLDPGGSSTASSVPSNAAGEPLVEVECETVAELREAIEAGADRALLDNMDWTELSEAVAIRDAAVGAPRPRPRVHEEAAEPLPAGVLLEASGGVTLTEARSIAETGVDLISVGALTHSAPALDVSMLATLR